MGIGKYPLIGALALAIGANSATALAGSREYIHFSGEPVAARLEDDVLDAILLVDGEKCLASTASGYRGLDVKYDKNRLKRALQLINSEIFDGDNEPITILGYYIFTDDGKMDRFVIEGVKLNNKTYYLDESD